MVGQSLALAALVAALFTPTPPPPQWETPTPSGMFCTVQPSPQKTSIIPTRVIGTPINTTPGPTLPPSTAVPPTPTPTPAPSVRWEGPLDIGFTWNVANLPTQEYYGDVCGGGIILGATIKTNAIRLSDCSWDAGFTGAGLTSSDAVRRFVVLGGFGCIPLPGDTKVSSIIHTSAPAEGWTGDYPNPVSPGFEAFVFWPTTHNYTWPIEGNYPGSVEYSDLYVLCKGGAPPTPTPTPPVGPSPTPGGPLPCRTPPPPGGGINPPYYVPGFCQVVLYGASLPLPPVTWLPDGWVFPENLTFPGVAFCFRYLVISGELFGMDIANIAALACALFAASLVINEFRS